MNDGSFDALTRRASIVTLSTAGLAAALADPFTARANKKGGKNKKKCKNPCSTQVGQCTTTIATLCAGEPSCQDSLQCCPILGRCDFSGFFACLIATA